MKRLFTVSIFSLLLLAALSFSGSADAHAQGRNTHSHAHTYRSPGPPDWAPAHGHRRNHDDHYYRKDRKGKHFKKPACDHCRQARNYESREHAQRRTPRMVKNGKIIIVVNP